MEASSISFIKVLFYLFSSLVFGISATPTSTEIITDYNTKEENVIIDGEIKEDISEKIITENREDISSDNKIKIQIFTDFECSYSARFANATKGLREKEDLDIEIIHFPLGFHPNAKASAKAVICAEKQGKIWEMHDTIFADQANLNSDNLREKAEKIELDLLKYDECFSSEDTEKEIEDDINYGIKKGVSATPTTFINDEKSVGALPIENIEKIIRKHQNKN